MRAPSIGFRLGADARSLWTDGRTLAVFWTGVPAAPAAKRSVLPRGVERFGAQSEKRIEIEGGTTPAGPSMTVRVHEGGVLEHLEGETVTDRVQAREIASTLVQRVVVPGESSFFGAGE